MEGFFSSSTMSELRCFLSDSLDLSPMITRWQYLQARDLGLIPGLGRSPGEEKGYPFQCSGLENSMDCIVHGVTELDTTERLVKNLPTNTGDPGDSGLIPGSGPSPGEGNGNPLQYSCLDNPVDRGASWPVVHGVTKR